jgi:acetyl esterase
MHLHGGHFVGGSIEHKSAFVDVLVATGAIVVSVAYPLSPESVFPKPLEAIFEVATWLAKHRGKIAGRGAHLWVAGEDAGGNLAASLSFMARDRQFLEIKGQVLLSPMLDCSVSSASARQSGLGHGGDPISSGWRSYLAHPADGGHPYATPGNSLRLHGLPPTLLVTARDDPLRDEGIHFVQRLQAAGSRADLLDLAALRASASRGGEVQPEGFVYEGRSEEICSAVSSFLLCSAG